MKRLKGVRLTDRGPVATVQTDELLRDRDGQPVASELRLLLPFEAIEWSTEEVVDWLRTNLRRKRQRVADLDAVDVDVKAVWLGKIRMAVSDWRDIREVKAEAEVRSAPQAVIDDLQAAEDSRWTNIVDLVQSWRAAT